MDVVNQRVHRCGIDAPSVIEVFGEAQGDLGFRGRDGRSAVVGIHDEQMHRVGAHVEHTEPHGDDATGFRSP